MSAGGNEGRYATIRLPPLSAREACLLAEVLDTVLVALWDAHGDALFTDGGSE